jgi:exosortase
MKARTLIWISICVVSVLLNIGLFRELLAYFLKNDFSSQMLLAPFMSAILIYRQRFQLSAQSKISPSGIALLCCGLILAMWPSGRIDLSARTLGIVMIWIGGFITVFGIAGFRKLLLPVLFLLFMIPIPEALLHAITNSLQRGSAEALAALLTLTHTPYYREGFVFVLPKLNVEIATQCSGIRSSLALFISTLLAAHMFLTSPWRKTALVLIAIPIAMLKNGIRIAVLCLLAIHVDKRFITQSDLHREGGILFFTLALLLLWPVLWGLRAMEKKAESVSNSKNRAPSALPEI